MTQQYCCVDRDVNMPILLSHGRDYPALWESRGCCQMAEKLVLAFAGAIGSGRTELSRIVHQRLNWPLLRFGDYLRHLAGEDTQAQERSALQRLGQTLVVSDTFGFVKGFLNWKPDWKEQGNLVIDGLRHAEIVVVLRQMVLPSDLKIVYVAMDDDSRQDRAMRDRGIESRSLSRFDQDITEAQIPRILPEYADLKVDGTLPHSILADQIVRRLAAMPPTVHAAQ